MKAEIYARGPIACVCEGRETEREGQRESGEVEWEVRDSGWEGKTKE